MNYYGFRVRLTTTNVTEIRRGTLIRRSIDEPTHALLSSPIAHVRVIYVYADGDITITFDRVRMCVYSVLVYISVL